MSCLRRALARLQVFFSGLDNSSAICSASALNWSAMDAHLENDDPGKQKVASYASAGSKIDSFSLLILTVICIRSLFMNASLPDRTQRRYGPLVLQLAGGNTQ